MFQRFYLLLMVVVSVQVFWTVAAHGCQRDLIPAIAHCGACVTSASMPDGGDNPDDNTNDDACGACHIVSIPAEKPTVGSIVALVRRAPAFPAQRHHSSHPAEGPERPKWIPSA